MTGTMLPLYTLTKKRYTFCYGKNPLYNSGKAMQYPLSFAAFFSTQTMNIKYHKVGYCYQVIVFTLFVVKGHFRG